MGEMSDFMTTIQTLNRISHLGGIKWVVECVFGDIDHPDQSMYNIINVYTSRDEAEQCAKDLSYSHGHQFLTFRSRPTGLFRPMVEPRAPTVFTTEMRDLDDKYATRLRREHELQVAETTRRDKIQAHLTKSSVSETPENYTRLVYQAYTREISIVSDKKRLEENTTVLDQLMSELVTQHELQPELQKSWLSYAHDFLETTGELSLFEKLKDWYAANFGE